jgi:hypothetical protein
MAFESKSKRPQEQTLSVQLVLEAGVAILDNKDLYMLYFIEDIFSSVITGKLQFADPYGAFELGPITGNEKIIVSYGQDEDREIEFVIYKVNTIQQMGQVESGTKQVFEIFFVEEMLYDLNHYTYSRAWTDTKTSDIVADILRVMLGDPALGEWEDSNEILENFYMPYWRPKDAIKWLIERSSGFTSKQGGYLFFNNRNGVNFITIDKLMTSVLMDTELYRLGTSESDWSYNNVLGWKVLGFDSAAKRFLRGGTRLGFDSSTKTFLESSNTYSDSISKHVVLGNYSMFTDISAPLAKTYLEGDSDISLLDNIHQNDFIKRYSKQMMVQITVPGRIKNRFCGGLVEIDWPSSVKSQVGNKMMKGFYLVKSITHQWSAHQNPPYLQKLVLLKNGYTDVDINKAFQLVKATKKNVAGDASEVYQLGAVT